MFSEKLKRIVSVFFMKNCSSAKSEEQKEKVFPEWFEEHKIDGAKGKSGVKEVVGAQPLQEKVQNLIPKK